MCVYHTNHLNSNAYFACIRPIYYNIVKKFHELNVSLRNVIETYFSTNNLILFVHSVAVDVIFSMWLLFCMWLSQNYLICIRCNRLFTLYLFNKWKIKKKIASLYYSLRNSILSQPHTYFLPSNFVILFLLISFI